MEEIRGDFWREKEKVEYNIICCTINCSVKGNGELVMVAGVAKQFKSIFSSLPTVLGKIYGSQKYTGITVIPSYISDIVAFPTKIDWRKPAIMNLIRKNAHQLVSVADALGWKRILITRPGCGRGGLYWGAVGFELNTIWDDRFTVINL